MPRSKDTLRKNPPREIPREDELRGTKKSLRDKRSVATDKNVNAKQTPKKSKYFQDADSEQSGDAASSTNGDTGDGSGSEPYGIGDIDEEEDDGQERPKTSKRGGWGWAHGRKRKTRENDDSEDKSSAAKGRLLWKEGVKTGLGPGKEVFIKLPKARETGDTPYKDDALHPNTLLFLKDLKANNEREWLKRHDADYRTSKKDWDTFVETLTEKIIEQDSTIPELPVKDLVFRIYRDVRFSNDPTPYKPNFAAAWSRTGRKGPYAVYYLHLEPGSCFIAAGLWMPDASQLALLRGDIDRRPRRIKEVLADAHIRRHILNGIPQDEKKVVEAFTKLNQQNALKTRPKGFDINHENIKLLRLRNFTLSKSLKDEDLMGPAAQGKIANLVGILAPFVAYLNEVVMPDNEESDEELSGDTESNDDASIGT